MHSLPVRKALRLALFLAVICVLISTAERDPDQKGSNKVFHLKFRRVAPSGRISVQLVDNDHGNTLAAYRMTGSPCYPTQAQVQQINRSAELPPADSAQLLNGQLDLDISPNGLVLVEAPPAATLP